MVLLLLFSSYISQILGVRGKGIIHNRQDNGIVYLGDYIFYKGFLNTL